MPNAGKRPAAAPASAPTVKRGRGGGSRGAGRKPSAVNKKGVDHADARPGKQVSLADLLGERYKAKPNASEQAVIDLDQDALVSAARSSSSLVPPTAPAAAPFKDSYELGSAGLM